MATYWSGCRDLNSGPLAPQASAIPGFATARSYSGGHPGPFAALQIGVGGECFLSFSEFITESNNRKRAVARGAAGCLNGCRISPLNRGIRSSILAEHFRR